MQAYGPSFARIYNQRWGGFARQAAPKIREFFEAQQTPLDNRKLLDLCCGSGLLAQHFLENGYQVTCLDLSESMLSYARKNTTVYQVAGLVQFVLADASNFQLQERFSLVVSTFDSLNHLPDLEALSRCFRSVYQVLDADGIFIFDLNTRLGLRRWSNLSLEDHEDLMLVQRGLFDEQHDRALVSISGFSRLENGLYERFQETVFNQAFDLDAVEESLLTAGFEGVYPARLEDLGAPVEEPEKEGRIFFVGRKTTP